MIRKGSTMDVSDIKLLQAIYYILASSSSIRIHMSVYEFRSFLIAELSGPYAAVFIIRSGDPFLMSARQEYRIRQTGL